MGSSDKGQSYWAPARHGQAMQEFLDQPYGIQGYNAYATGSVTHFDRARLLEEETLSTILTVQFTLLKVMVVVEIRWNSMLADLQSSPSADEPTITLNTLQGGQGSEDTYAYL